ILDMLSGKVFHHELPHQNGRSGRGNHLVAFSNNCLSFVASTRYEPEKVISYWGECTIPSKNHSVESEAPFVRLSPPPPFTTQHLPYITTALAFLISLN